MAEKSGDRELADLLARCRKGDGRAWSALVDRFQTFVYSVPRRMGLNEDDAADVFQNTFVALHRSLDRLEAAEALPKWLAVTAARESLRTRRIRTRAPVVASEESERSLEEVVASAEASAEEEAVRACDARTVREAILRLQERCAKLLTALYLDLETSYQEISERLGIPVGAIGPTRARCLEKLRRDLEKRGFHG
jgi:RNA polymerase sigma factor (sigma-70 family)